MGAITEATDESIAAATHLTDLHAGEVVILRRLARKLDEQEELIIAVAERRAKPRYIDPSVAVQYLRVAETLGLTPPKNQGGRPPASSQPQVPADAAIIELRQRTKEVTSEQ